MKPILFNTEMVRAILDGRKTTTRRIVRKKYSNTDLTMFTNKYGTRLIEQQNDAPKPIEFIGEDGVKRTRHSLIACVECKLPYQPNEFLYVRETWRIQSAHRFGADAKIEFKAGGPMQKLNLRPVGRCKKFSLQIPVASLPTGMITMNLSENGGTKMESGIRPSTCQR